MSTTETTTSTPTSTQGDQLILYPEEKPGTGWLFFAATVLGLAGLMRLIDSLWAFRYHGALPDNLQNAVFGDNLKTYGWVWLGVGIVLIVASVLIVVRSQIGRWVGMVAAAVGGLTAMTWMPYYPIWSLTYVLAAVLVLYALARYGSRDPAPAR
jgi:hypothetical protein